MISTSSRRSLEGKAGSNTSNLLDLYRGSFAIVRSGVNKKTGANVAIKIIERYAKVV